MEVIYNSNKSTVTRTEVDFIELNYSANRQVFNFKDFKGEHKLAVSIPLSQASELVRGELIDFTKFCATDITEDDFFDSSDAQEVVSWYINLPASKRDYIDRSYSAFAQACRSCDVKNADKCRFFLSSWSSKDIKDIMLDVDGKSLPDGILL